MYPKIGHFDDQISWKSLRILFSLIAVGIGIVREST